MALLGYTECKCRKDTEKLHVKYRNVILDLSTIVFIWLMPCCKKWFKNIYALQLKTLVFANSERTDSSQCANADHIANICLQDPYNTHTRNIFPLVYQLCCRQHIIVITFTQKTYKSMLKNGLESPPASSIPQMKILMKHYLLSLQHFQVK